MVAGSRFTVLCASSTGRLQLLDLQHQEHPHMRTLPLLPPARPTHLAVHPHKPMLLVACQGTDGIWELRCMHAVTGTLSSTTKAAPLYGQVHTYATVRLHMSSLYIYSQGIPSPALPCPALPCPALPCPAC